MKVNASYRKANESDARYRVLYGGAGSGKSYYMLQEIMLNMLDCGDYRYLAVRKTGKSIRHSIYQGLRDLISQENLSDFFSISKTEMSITCVTGATLITSGLDDVEKLKSIAGINRIWVEEASEISEADFNQLDLRMRGTSPIGYQMTLTFNPISELHWLKKKFFDLGVEDSFVLKTTYKDNKHLDQGYIDKLKRLEKEDYQFFRIYALGEWGSIGNLIFSNWEKKDLSKHKFDNFFNGLDFGFADDPTAPVRCHYDKKHKTIYITEAEYRRGIFIDDVADIVKDMIGNEVITCDSSEPRSIADLRRHGIKAVGAKKGPGSIEHGIKWLQGHKIVVHHTLTDMISELSTYKWREDKDGNIIPKPVDANNHLIDALRYALESEMRMNRMRTLDKRALGL